MRIRRKPWAIPELLASGFYIEEPKELKNNWRNKFENNSPLYLELGCGKGSFVAQSAFNNPDVNYVAVDIKSEMLGLAKRNIEKVFADKRRPNNVLLTAYDVERISDVFGEEDSIDRIYINFCNPWPRAKHNKHRLTYTRQLNTYKQFLKKDSEIHFKTDDDGLFLSSKRYFDEAGFDIEYITYDLHAEDRTDNIVTEHEKMFSDDGIKIKFLIAKQRGE